MRTARFTPGDIVTSVRLELFSRRESDARIEELFAPLTTESIIALRGDLDGALTRFHALLTAAFVVTCNGTRRSVAETMLVGAICIAEGLRVRAARPAWIAQHLALLDEYFGVHRVLAIVMHEYEDRCEIRSLLRPTDDGLHANREWGQRGAKSASSSPRTERGTKAAGIRRRIPVELQTRAAIRLRLRIAVDNSLTTTAGSVMTDAPESPIVGVFRSEREIQHSRDVSEGISTSLLGGTAIAATPAAMSPATAAPGCAGTSSPDDAVYISDPSNNVVLRSRACRTTVVRSMTISKNGEVSSPPILCRSNRGARKHSTVDDQIATTLLIGTPKTRDREDAKTEKIEYEDRLPRDLGQVSQTWVRQARVERHPPPTNGNEPIFSAPPVVPASNEYCFDRVLCGGSGSSRGHYGLTERRTASPPELRALEHFQRADLPVDRARRPWCRDPSDQRLPVTPQIVCESPPQRRERRREPSPEALDVVLSGEVGKAYRNRGSLRRCETDAAVHGTLEHLQPADLPFGLRVALERRQCSLDRPPILRQVSREGLQRRDAAGARFEEPPTEFAHRIGQLVAIQAAGAHQLREPLRQIDNAYHFGILPDPSEVGRGMGRQRRDGPNRGPGQLLSRSKCFWSENLCARRASPRQPFVGDAPPRRRAQLGNVAMHLPMSSSKALVADLASERHGALAALGHALLQMGEIGVEARRIGPLVRALGEALNLGVLAHGRARQPCSAIDRQEGRTCQITPTHVLVGCKPPSATVTTPRDLSGAATVGAQAIPGMAAITDRQSGQLTQPTVDAAEPAFERWAHVQEVMPSISDRKHNWRASGECLGVLGGPVAGDDLDAGIATQPVGDGHSRTVGQQVDWATAFEIDEA